MKVFASILAADLLSLREELDRTTRAGVDGIHVDVMDGHFVQEIIFGPLMTAQIRTATTLPIDVHLMVSNPEELVEEYCLLGADQITVHYENCLDIKKMSSIVHQYGKKLCVAINLETSPEKLAGVLSVIDAVLVIAVKVGIGGQQLKEEALDKITVLNKMIRSANQNNIEISVDGGVNRNNITQLRAAGTSSVVVGTALFTATDMTKEVEHLRFAAKIQ